MPTPCPFCHPSDEVLLESDLACALADKYPVTRGHTLVISRRHVADYFALDEASKRALWHLVDRVRDDLVERFHPDGFTIGVNVGAAAGQTIPHVHVHVIPRYAGDVENPTGGVRNVIPGKGDYLNRNPEGEE